MYKYRELYADFEREYTWRNVYRVSMKCGKDAPMVEYQQDGDIKTISYPQADRYIAGAALRLAARLGDKPGFVGLQMANAPTWPLLFWAVLRSGHDMLLLDAAAAPAQRDYFLEQTGATAVITTSDAPLPSGVVCLRPEELVLWEGDPAACRFPWGDRVALCTNGTTATARVFVYDGRSIVNQALSTRDTWAKNHIMGRPDVVEKSMIFLPLHHIFGLVAGFLVNQMQGGSAIFPPDMTPERVMEACRKHRVTYFVCVPLFWNTLATGVMKRAALQGKEARAALEKGIDTSLRIQKWLPRPLAMRLLSSRLGKYQDALLGRDMQCMISGGGHILPDTLRLLNGLGYRMMNGYGSTEGGIFGLAVEEDVSERLKGHVGVGFWPNAGRVRPTGDDENVGEMMIRTAYMHAGRMENGEYIPWDRDNAWFATGDMVRYENGRFYIEGRIKEVIVGESGENVYPDELEDTFLGLPGVSKLCATGVKNGPYEEITLILECDPAPDASQRAAILEELRRRNAALPLYKQVRRVLLSRQPLPLANGMKVKRQALRGAVEEASWPCEQWELREADSAAPTQGAAASLGKPETRPNESGGGRERVLSPVSPFNESFVATGVSKTDLDAAQAPRPPKSVDAPNDPAGAALESASPDSIRAEVRAIFARVLALREETISDDAHFVYDLGGNSLTSLSLLAEAEKHFQILIHEEEYLSCTNVRDVSRLIMAKLEGKTAPMPQSEASAAEEPARVHLITRFEDTPEYQAFLRRIEVSPSLEKLGNPYFIAHDSIVRDTSLMGGREVVNFGSYNYLGLSGHPETMRAAMEAAEQYGTSASGSRLLSGEKTLHRELERAIADWKHTEAALALVSGHATNVTFVGNFCGSKDLILYDALSHNSVAQGCRLSQSASRAFPHNDVEALEHILRRRRDRYEKILVSVEGVYSMDGDIAPIAEYVRLKKEYGFFLMVDEAHSSCTLGAHGGGVDEYFGLEPEDIDVKMGTLSKGLGSCGGYLAGRFPLIEYLRYNMPGFVFSVGMSPPLAAAALKGIEIIRRDDSLVRRLHHNIHVFLTEAERRGLDTCQAQEQSPVAPIRVGDDERACRLSLLMQKDGVFVPPAVYPAVPRGQARLRYCLVADHKEEQIVGALDLLARHMRE